MVEFAAVHFVTFFLNVSSQEFLSGLGRFLGVIACSNNEQFPGVYFCVSPPFISPPCVSWEFICCLPRDIWVLFSQTRLGCSSFTLPYGVIKGEIETISKCNFTDEIVTDGFICHLRAPTAVPYSWWPHTLPACSVSQTNTSEGWESVLAQP